MSERWTAWHRPYRETRDLPEQPWTRVLTGEDEADVRTQTHELRLPGQVMILPGNLDPNHPQPREARSGRHHGTQGVLPPDPPVVARGRSAERLYQGRVE